MDDLEKLLDLIKKQEQALKELEQRNQEIKEQALKREQELKEQFKAHEQAMLDEFAKFFDTQTETLVKGVSDHIENKVVESFEQRFGVESEAAQHAKEFPFQEQGQVAAQFLKANGELKTVDELIAESATTWDEFNYMGGLSNTQSQAQEWVDPFSQVEPTVSPTLDQETKDIITAIDYQVQNYSKVDNFPISDEQEPVAVAQNEPQATVIPFSKEKAQSAIKSMRDGATGSDTGSTGQAEPQVATKTEVQENIKSAREQAFEDFSKNPTFSLTKKDESHNTQTITQEMQAAAMSGAEFFNTQNVIEKNKGFPVVEQYATMSRLDERLSEKTMMAEFSDDTYKKTGVVGDEKILVNYFDKVALTEYYGKTGEAHREQALEKNDIQTWSDSFGAARVYMEKQHKLEADNIFNKGTDEQIKAMELKHKTEKKMFNVLEADEINKMHSLFPNELPETYSFYKPPVAKTIAEDKAELLDTFKDYAAHRAGGTWKHTYKDESQNPFNQKNIKKEAVVFSMQRVQKQKNHVEVQTFDHDKVKSRVKGLRQSM